MIEVQITSSQTLPPDVSARLGWSDGMRGLWCPTCLAPVAYTWRANDVLTEIAEGTYPVEGVLRCGHGHYRYGPARRKAPPLAWPDRAGEDVAESALVARVCIGPVHEWQWWGWDQVALAETRSAMLWQRPRQDDHRTPEDTAKFQAAAREWARQILYEAFPIPLQDVPRWDGLLVAHDWATQCLPPIVSASFESPPRADSRPNVKAVKSRGGLTRRPRRKNTKRRKNSQEDPRDNRGSSLDD